MSSNPFAAELTLWVAAASNTVDLPLVITTVVALSAAGVGPVVAWLLANRTERRRRRHDEITVVLGEVDERVRQAHDEMPLTPVSVVRLSLTKLARDVERLADSGPKSVRDPLLAVAALLRQLHDLTESATPDPKAIVRQERVRAALEDALRTAREAVRATFGG